MDNKKVVSEPEVGVVTDEEYEYHMAIVEIAAFVLKYGANKVIQDIDEYNDNKALVAWVWRDFEDFQDD
jgi:hypothetical protein